MHSYMVWLVFQLLEKWVFRTLLSLGWKESFFLLALVFSADFKNRVKLSILLV
jgi:hypothetical protein